MSEHARDETPKVSPKEKKPAEREEPRNDLVVEHWQAPRPDKMKADSREVWEYESEKVRPSGTLWFNFVAIVLALLLGLALIFYGVWRLASSIDPSVPEIP